MVSSTLFSFSVIISLASAVVKSPVQGPLKGFNYNPDDDPKTLFPVVKDGLPKIGAPGFSSARLYTTLAQGTEKATPHPAFKAAGDTNTSILIGLAVSLGDASFQNELTALEAVLEDNDNTYGNLVSKNLIVGISVGNEDFYRQSLQGTPMGNNLGAGSKATTIMKQINQVRQRLAKMDPPLDTKIPVGHADTRAMWTRDEYGKQLLQPHPDQGNFKPVDFIGMQEFQYWEGYDIHNWTSFRTETLPAIKAVAGDIPVWVTETGWPTTGPKCCDGAPADSGMKGELAYTGKKEAQIFWKNVGCDTLFAGGSDARNVWWYRVLANTDKSSKADAPRDWDILSGIKGDDATASFPLDCNVVPPTVPAPTAAKVAGAAMVVPGWGVVLPVLAMLAYGLVGTLVL